VDIDYRSDRGGSFSKNKINLLVPILGASEAGKDEIVLDKKNAREKSMLTVGDYLVFELADGTTKKLKVVGVVQDASSGAG
jgi:hypothetical protein